MIHTRFEKARIIGARALQITMGAPLILKGVPNFINVVDIAESEYHKSVIPINVLRDV